MNWDAKKWVNVKIEEWIKELKIYLIWIKIGKKNKWIWGSI